MKCFLLVVGVFISLSASAQIKEYSFSQIDSLQKVEQRHVVVYMHTSWCKFCQKMELTTLKDDSLITLLNQKFYFVSFDVEKQSEVTFKGHVYRFKPTGLRTGIHELADKFSQFDDELAYPSICVLDYNHEVMAKHNEYIAPEDLILALKAVK
jgi:thioredoxin-related protein